MTHRLPIRGLYAITPFVADDTALFAMCQAAIDGGAKILQYRDKESAANIKHRRGVMLAKLCRQKAIFIINDDIHLAMSINADGVHLGDDDMDIKTARKIGGARFIIGATCGNQPDKVKAAATAGADYCAVGAVFASPTKPDAPHCPPATIAIAKKIGGLPIVAIGGITATNARSIFAAGADAVAVCSGLFTAADVAQTARQLAQMQN